MKTAFLIMAHRQPGHLARLLRVLDGDWNTAFIHIDRRVDDRLFKAASPQRKNILFLERSSRIASRWCGFGSVRAALNLLRAALASGRDFDRFCLLSGADFPIKSIAHIREQFNTSTEFIRIARRLGPHDEHEHMQHVRYYHFRDNELLKRLPRIIPRKLYPGMTLYQGSQWWALTSGCIRFIMDFVQAHPEYARFQRYFFCPDEIFFHSLVKNSPFAAHIYHDLASVPAGMDPYSLTEHGCHFVDWKFKGLTVPKILDGSDLPRLLASPALFARKFDEQISRDLILELERCIAA